MAGRLALAVREAGAEQNGRERECVRWKKKRASRAETARL